MEKPDCRQCKHRRNVVGSAHSSCSHPSVKGKDQNDFGALVQLVSGKFVEAAMELNITAHPIGINNGWFLWPADFDPVWLRSCNGFEAKEQPQPIKEAA